MCGLLVDIADCLFRYECKDKANEKMKVIINAVDRPQYECLPGDDLLHFSAKHRCLRVLLRRLGTLQSSYLLRMSKSESKKGESSNLELAIKRWSENYIEYYKPDTFQRASSPSEVLKMKSESEDVSDLQSESQEKPDYQGEPQKNKHIEYLLYNEYPTKSEFALEVTKLIKWLLTGDDGSQYARMAEKLFGEKPSAE
jgi:hypothetical protein